MDATLQAALNQDAVCVFFALEIILPAHAIRLIDGSGSVTFGGHVFTGQDDTFGVLDGVQPIADGVADQAPVLTFRLLPPSNTAVADLCAPEHQGSIVQCWLGAVDLVTGLVLGEPDLLFIGEVDVPTLAVDKGTRSVEFVCVSVFERMFSDSEGARLTNQFHQSLFPGETGLEFVTAVQRQLPWGVDAPRPAAVVDTTAEINAGNARLYT